MLDYSTDKRYIKLNAAREKYKPEQIKILFIAEAPPEAPNRFFYYENVKDNDWLYLGIIKALCSFNEYRISYTPKNARKNKATILKELQNDGIFLMDLSPLPISILPPKLWVTDFFKRLELEHIDKTKTSIILIKPNVYSCLAVELRNRGYSVIQKDKIEFPSNGHQKKFAEKMDKILKACNYIPGKGVTHIRKLIN